VDKSATRVAEGGLFEILSADNGVGEDFGVCEFDSRACGDASSEAGDFYAGIFEEGTDVKSGAVSGEIWIGGEDDFGDAAIFYAVNELIDIEAVGVDAVKRSDVSSEDVIDPFAGAGFFEIDDVSRLFDDTNNAFISSGVGADFAEGIFGKIAADFASFDFGFDVGDGLCEAKGLIGFGVKDMEGEPFSGFGTDAWEMTEFIDKPVQTVSINIAHRQ
jgi:hypothetical protein